MEIPQEIGQKLREATLSVTESLLKITEAAERAAIALHKLKTGMQEIANAPNTDTIRLEQVRERRFS